jgi:NADP-dependent 3-hydroxy acid dehydrogenase YdfG
VETEFGRNAITDPKRIETMKKLPKLTSENVANAVLYVLSTPPDVQVIDELFGKSSF